MIARVPQPTFRQLMSPLGSHLDQCASHEIPRTDLAQPNDRFSTLFAAPVISIMTSQGQRTSAPTQGLDHSSEISARPHQDTAHALETVQRQRVARVTSFTIRNRSTEAVNLIIERARRLAHGFRSFEHYRLRILLAASKKRWLRGSPHPHLDPRNDENKRARHSPLPTDQQCHKQNPRRPRDHCRLTHPWWRLRSTSISAITVDRRPATVIQQDGRFGLLLSSPTQSTKHYPNAPDKT